MSPFNVNPYRWPGWFLAALGVLYGVVVVIVFKETHSWIDFKTDCSLGRKRFSPLRTIWSIRVVTVSNISIQ